VRFAVGHKTWPAEHVITELPGGVRVASERVPAVRSVALGFWIGTGSITETDEQAGLSHLLEHMLFAAPRATARRRSTRSSMRWAPS
jgi:predicted Zn-dependent peptidase